MHKKHFKMKDKLEIKVHFDGACEPFNPGGRMGFGVHISTGDKVLHTHSEQTDFDPKNTNNVAEYRALNIALQWLLENDYSGEEISVFGDSALVINQMNGTWRARGGRYFSEYLQAQKIRELFSDITFTWVRREYNDVADRLSKKDILTGRQTAN